MFHFARRAFFSFFNADDTGVPVLGAPLPPAGHADVAPGSVPAPVSLAAHESAVRDCAFHLYSIGNGEHGHDLDHWLIAEACVNDHAKSV